MDVESIAAYVSLNEANKDVNVGAPELSTSTINAIVANIQATLLEAMRRMRPEANGPHYLIFHVETPQTMGARTLAISQDEMIRVYPSFRAGKNQETVSTLCIKVEAPTNQSAEPAALQKLGLFCALMTLGSDQVFQIAHLKWTPRHPKIKYVDSPDDIDIARLYPYTKESIQPALWDPWFELRLQWIWGRFMALSDQQRGQFLQPLLAYYSARLVEDKQATLAVVPYVAALGSLAASRVQKCSGNVDCDIHGRLANFQHNTVGDKAAIVEFVTEVLALTPEKSQHFNRLMGKVYSKQRSSFVHSAELRHEEFFQGTALPLSFPTPTGFARPLYHYKIEFSQIKDVTRSALISWLAAQTRAEVPPEVAGDYEYRTGRRVPVEISITTLGRRLVGIIQVPRGLDATGEA